MQNKATQIALCDTVFILPHQLLARLVRHNRGLAEYIVSPPRSNRFPISITFFTQRTPAPDRVFGEKSGSFRFIARGSDWLHVQWVVEKKKLSVFISPHTQMARRTFNQYLKTPETLYILFKIVVLQYFCIVRKALVFHAAAVLFKDHCFVFAGHSGAGKSTCVSLFSGLAGVRILNDEHVIVLPVQGKDFIYSNPFVGRKTMHSLTTIPFKVLVDTQVSFFYLRQSRDNKIVRTKSFLPITATAFDAMPLPSGAFFKRYSARVLHFLRGIQVADLYFRKDDSLIAFLSRYSKGCKRKELRDAKQKKEQ